MSATPRTANSFLWPETANVPQAIIDHPQTDKPIPFEEAQQILTDAGVEVPADDEVWQYIIEHREHVTGARIELKNPNGGPQNSGLTVPGALIFFGRHDGSNRGRWGARLTFDEVPKGEVSIRQDCCGRGEVFTALRELKKRQQALRLS